jgi:aryl-alcohol dehydrogenase-like predicted oxidoreductase
MLWMEPERYEYHRETGLPMIAYQSQAHGILHRLAAGTLDRVRPSVLSPYDLAATRERLARIRRVMAESGLTLTQVVLGYLRSQPFVTVPIVGPRRVEQLLDSLSAADVRLSPEQVRFVEVGSE